jgi:hypothetical protein
MLSSGRTFALDAAEGPERLARHAMAEIATQLAADEGADAWATRVNELLRRLVADEDDWANSEVVLPARVLPGIKPRAREWCSRRSGWAVDSRQRFRTILTRR